MKIFNLPDLGEGLPDAEIVEWHVSQGDTVTIDQPLVAMETAKAVVDVPSPFAGKIAKLHGEPGDVINTGAPLVELEGGEREDTGTVAGEIEVGTEVLEEQKTIVSKRVQSGIKATPAVRALAKRLKVNLDTVSPTGNNNTITRKDVENAAEASSKSKLPNNFEPLKGVRRQMAQTMSQSHAVVVPVTIIEDAVLFQWKAGEDITVRIMQALAAACKAEPALNAFFDGEHNARNLQQQLNLGVAMDTEDGLFVPVIQNIGDKTAADLRSEMDSLKTEVSNRSIAPEKMKDFTFILSNFGKFAGRYANPVIVPPTVGILGVGKLRDDVVPLNGEPAVSKVLPMALTFDHRACTGGEATRFMGVLKEHLELPEAK